MSTYYPIPVGISSQLTGDRILPISSHNYAAMCEKRRHKIVPNPRPNAVNSGLPPPIATTHCREKKAQAPLSLAQPFTTTNFQPRRSGEHLKVFVVFSSQKWHSYNYFSYVNPLYMKL
ncbi:hypothetical protein PanWU01x14_000820 [Parasponia andersonii]|uniref:Uncharacterized protein n=1 Tax=Parasponia andersonii TaxID=3476 RepID=A0A2P5E4R1_PARAD|nr:hypothetical protein PanWU01x14_000820 [Parasponia andersonii]